MGEVQTESQSSRPGDAKERNKVRLNLLFISLLSLFVELLIIRWLSTEVRIFSYFKNLPLLSAFLGLSLGFIWWRRKTDFFKWSALAFLYLSGLLIVALFIGLTHLSLVPADIVLFGDFSASNSGVSVLFRFMIMILIFVLTAFPFVGMGQRTGQLFQKLRPLEAYGINVTGGFLGVLLFSVLSFLSTSPGVWLVVCGALFFLIDKKIVNAAIIVLGLTYSFYLVPVTTPLAFGPEYIKTVWSPYYRIDLKKSIFREGPLKGERLGTDVLINYDSFQSMVDTSEKSVSRFSEPLKRQVLDFHGKPFRLRNSDGARVLILGAGSGSDVAAALRNGAGHVDAVEIDPDILKLGKQMHPDNPYSSPKVTTYNMDARTFLKNSKEKYDFIVFGLLDSHTAFSSMSSLRTDNYIFTRQALQEAYRLLKDDGIITIAFIAIPDWLWQRQVNNLTAATGTPIAGWFKKDHPATGFIAAGPGLKDDVVFESPGWARRDASADPNMATCTDDWPYLFLPRPGVPVIYWAPLLAILVTGVIPVATQFVQGARHPFNWQMFGLGAGFMLLEVRAIADMSLIFGSTWLVNSFIIGGVMLIILIGAYLAAKLSSERHVVIAGAGLIITLAATTLLNCAEFSRWGLIAGGLAGTTVYLFPLVFASVIFGLLFKTTNATSEALAFNLVGGIFGICLEYLGMWLGNRSLGWIAIVIYATVILSYALLARKQGGEAAPVES